MFRTVVSIPALLLVIALATPPFEGTPFAADPAVADLMQCMESCIRNEGGNSAANKQTCKYRCARVQSGPPGQASSGGCMKSFKACRGSCDRDKTCKRTCKKTLMSCK